MKYDCGMVTPRGIHFVFAVAYSMWGNHKVCCRMQRTWSFAYEPRSLFWAIIGYKSVRTKTIFMMVSNANTEIFVRLMDCDQRFASRLCFTRSHQYMFGAICICSRMICSILFLVQWNLWSPHHDAYNVSRYRCPGKFNDWTGGRFFYFTS